MTSATVVHSASDSLVNVSCPGCGGQRTLACHEAADMPQGHTIWAESREAAVTIPRGLVRIGYCSACGLLANTARESIPIGQIQASLKTDSLDDDELLHELVHKWDVHCKAVLEIGCRKGEFLRRLCQEGENRGIGVDSLIDSAPIEGENFRVEFIRDEFSEKYAHLAADVVICRQSLDSVGNPQRFLRTVRRSIGRRFETLVLFEQRNVVPILRGAAFWEFGYHPCVHFSMGTLTRLLRSVGFDLLKPWLSDDGTQLYVMAQPAPCPTDPEFPLEDEADTVRNAVKLFRRNTPRRIDRWRARFDRWFQERRRVVLWGADSATANFCATLKIGKEVEFIVACDMQAVGQHLVGTGQEVVSPDWLSDYRPEVVIALDPRNYVQAESELAARRLTAELIRG